MVAKKSTMMMMIKVNDYDDGDDDDDIDDDCDLSFPLLGQRIIAETLKKKYHKGLAMEIRQ